MNKTNRISIIASILLAVTLMGIMQVFSVDVIAAENNNHITELGLGKSPLVEEANSRAAEESRLAAEDDTSEFIKFFKNGFNKLVNSFERNFITNNGWLLLLKGLGVTLLVTFFAIIVGIILGFIVGIIRSVYDITGKLTILNKISKVYITIIRGTPVIVQLLIINYVIFQSLNVNKVIVAVIAFGINSGAYVAEIFRSGIMSIDIGQTEAGRSLGLTYRQTMTSIIMPQAIKNVLPALGNEFIVLLKETSVSSFIALGDLTTAGNIIQSNTYDFFWPLMGVAIIYLVVVMGLTKLLTILERRLRKSDSR